MLGASQSRSIATLAIDLKAQAGAAYHRHALTLAGDREWTLAAAMAALSGVDGGLRIWLTERDLPRRGAHERCLPISRGSGLMGSELDVLVYDAHGGFDPDSFGAALGALRGGGLLLLLTPELTAWPRSTDPQAARVAVHPYRADQVGGRFLFRFARILARSSRSNGIVLVEQHKPIPRPVEPTVYPIPKTEPQGDCRTPDQAQALEALLETAYGRPRRPLVLTSDRGRGKSSVLGIAVSRLLANEPRTILVTAPRRAAIDPLFDQAARLLPQAQVQTNRIMHRAARLEFLPPDALCRAPRTADLLLVDEAAGIPAPLLEQLLRGYPRIAFATTVHGYEGTGRGFEVRFRRILDHRTPGWRELQLTTPIRWAPRDPLEAFAAAALLLNAAPATHERVVGASPATCRCLRLDRDGLIDEGSDEEEANGMDEEEANGITKGAERTGKERSKAATTDKTGERILSQLFGLLVLAHYQTRPLDLRHLLDGPNLQVYVLLHRDRVVATALVAIEGGLATDLARAVFAGHRRPRGHLLPQTLCVHAGLMDAAALRYARVIRIAVHPAVQGRGLGRTLLEGILAQVRGQDPELDLVGSSFGATADLLAFWEHCGFTPVHLGSSRNAASGAHAAAVLRPLSAAGHHHQHLARERSGRRLPALLGEPLHDLEPAVAACLLRWGLARQWSPDPTERAELTAFAGALRPYEASLPALGALAGAGIGAALRAGTLADDERDVLIMKVLQHRDWGETAHMLGLTGRAQVVALLRRAAARLMERMDQGA